MAPSAGDRWSDRANDLWTSLLDSETPKARAGRLALVPVSLGIAASLYLCALTLGRDTHLRFWAGDLSLITLLSTMAALASCFLFLVSARVIHFFRITSEVPHRMNQVDKARSCEPTLAHVRTYLVLMLALSICSMVLCGLSIAEGLRANLALTADCGKAGASQELQLVYDELEAFRKENCDAPDRPVHECEGFAEAFLPARPYMSYLEVVEKGDECGGFCTQGKPLFFPDVDAKAPTCAEVLAGRVQTISLAIGIPCLILGAMMASWGVAVFAFPGI
mmetsp:Transcript_58808/g.140196  ORF Transcript_58808/g.140196 Transcript_58808/m.140196 type:complete len:278 (-) Transcript_58808:16-849(-)